MTVTGASITASTLISGLSFLDGDLATGAACPDYCGGGILIRDGHFPYFAM